MNRSEPDEADPPQIITCVECGGRAHLLSHYPDDGFQPGDIIAYRCEDCLERLDLEWHPAG